MPTCFMTSIEDVCNQFWQAGVGKKIIFVTIYMYYLQ